jgi:dTDP-glucose 4,6-dehydratase
VVDQKLGRAHGTSQQLITFVKDRAGHDMRYAIDSSKIQNELGWQPSLQFEEGLAKTVEWYLKNSAWLENVSSGAYQAYYNKQYHQR